MSPTRGTRRRAALAGVVALLTLLGLWTATAAGAAAAGCKVVYTVGSQWGGGFTANVAITNLGDAVSSWRLTWAFPGTQSVTQAWNATVTANGANVTATNASYNGSIATNGTTSFGFNGTFTGSNPVPTTFALNGMTCTGTSTPTSPPPTTPPVTTPPPTTPPPTTPPPAGGDAEATVAAMQPGWNLGNSLDATGADETSWGNPRITEALLDGVKAQGFKSIRIPVTWGQHQGGAPSYTIEAAYLARVKEVVNWALADGFYVMINVHHDSWQWLNTMPGAQARYDATWTQIAAAFRDSPNKLVFESVNEPQFTDEGQSATHLNSLNTSFHRIVRGSGGGNATRLLVLPTLHTSADQVHLDALATTIASLNDRNIAATVHYYGYWPFSVNIAGTTTFDATTQADLVGYLDRSAATFTAKGIPVILGEWGLLGFDRSLDAVEQGEKLKFFEYLGYYARQKKITTMLWDNGQHFDRTALTWRDPELYAHIKSAWTTRSGTANTDQIFLSKSTAIAAKTLTLNPNGTTFTALRLNDTDLVRGTDYTISGNELTLSAALLTRLAGDRAYGVNARITAVFSAGVPWRINVISYDTPTVAAGTGTTAAFTIPVSFRGDRIATMEAKYADGGNAGPQNWTSFKEFAYTFLPDYTANTLALTPEFFAEVNDGAKVTLTLHFWSGAKVTYYVTKSGSTVTGATA
ncbi:cellulase family glycosylhydrolase [Actinoplanes sp. Pm04-4]|uniref:cellulase n=1 Tax=Paractinoplanes pyxinae TaxID=2997416 RepID=A0ABT4B9W2_9ACTN|nr:cellulase family glycosylhydrolase [Actinoplanes pyxinae]MCY1143301.1 cellulase family glycosylhydrolase [Actinoplanes pyxinae]